MSDDPSILIVGGGVAGLLTAVELHRYGFRNIRIIERSNETLDSGDGFIIHASALTTMHLYPDMLEDYKKIQDDTHNSIYKYDGTKMFGPIEAEWNQPNAAKHAAKVYVSFVASRPKFMTMLQNEAARRGIPLEKGVSVSDFGEDAERGVAWAVLKDGSKIEANLVIAADGVGTKSHKAVTGQVHDAHSSGYAIFRTSVPTDKALASPVVRDGIGWKKGDRPEWRLYLG